MRENKHFLPKANLLPVVFRVTSSVLFQPAAESHTQPLKNKYCSLDILLIFEFQLFVFCKYTNEKPIVVPSFRPFVFRSLFPHRFNRSEAYLKGWLSKSQNQAVSAVSQNYPSSPSKFSGNPKKTRDAHYILVHDAVYFYLQCLKGNFFEILCTSPNHKMQIFHKMVITTVLSLIFTSTLFCRLHIWRGVIL